MIELYVSFYNFVAAFVSKNHSLKAALHCSRGHSRFSSSKTRNTSKCATTWSIKQQLFFIFCHCLCHDRCSYPCCYSRKWCAKDHSAGCCLFFHLETILLLRNNTTAHSVLLILFLLASIPYFVYQIFYVACCQISSNYCPHPECLFWASWWRVMLQLQPFGEITLALRLSTSSSQGFCWFSSLLVALPG